MGLPLRVESACNLPPCLLVLGMDTFACRASASLQLRVYNNTFFVDSVLLETPITSGTWPFTTEALPLDTDAATSARWLNHVRSYASEFGGTSSDMVLDHEWARAQRV